MGPEIVPVCGPMPETTDTLAQWAACNYQILVFIVVVTMLVLFIISMVAMLKLVTRSHRY